MTDLRPMLIMVCEPCARGDFDQEVVEGCSICNAVAGVPQPARTREEMVEATMVAMYGGQTFEYRDDGKEPVRRAHALYRAERVLIKAGVIEEEERDANV